MSLPKITSVMLVVTHACPLACRYCFVHQEPSRMSFETAKATAEFLIANAEAMGAEPSINFFGGEPMVMWDEIIVPLTKWIREEYKKPFDLGITTNGVLLNEERIQFMKDNQIGILFSIDGNRETQDYNRPYHNGKSSFDTLEPLIPLISEAFPMVTFRTTVIPATCHHLFENVKYAASQGFTKFFTIPNVFEEWNDLNREVLFQEIRKYGDYYIESCRSGQEPIDFTAISRAFNDIRQINNAISNREYRTRPQCKACGKCGLGSGIFASVHPNGNIYGCQEMTSNEGEESIFYIGNIFTGVEEERRIKLMDMFDKEVVTGKNCQSCKYNRICDGGCVANNYLITGSLNVVPEIYCWWTQLILDEAIRIMQILGREENELFRQKWGEN